MKKVILLTPLSGSGGIASWSRKFIKTFPQEEYQIIPIDRSVKGRRFEDNRLWSRFYAGIKEMMEIKAKVKAEIKSQKIDILHTTTSGSFGTFRDYLIARLCKQSNIQTIMHCRYGCISEDVAKGVFGWFLRKTMRLYSQIWVLDRRSQDTLRSISGLENKVFLTPNSIEVRENIDITPKSYHRVAFIANLVPTKGLFEIIEAVIRLDNPKLVLFIIGKGSDEVMEHIKKMAGDRLGKTIVMKGQLPNEEAIEFMKTIDIMALPSYMPYEAFPISILEAMSLGKLVIATRRAAMRDMLTGLDGKPCGIFVGEKSVDDIVRALDWCIKNCSEADILCRRAYEKVYEAYRMEVVYSLYASLYKRL